MPSLNPASRRELIRKFRVAGGIISGAVVVRGPFSSSRLCLAEWQPRDHLGERARPGRFGDPRNTWQSGKVAKRGGSDGASRKMTKS